MGAAGPASSPTRDDLLLDHVFDRIDDETHAALAAGVHQHPATYTLTLTNTTEAPTQAVTLQDFIPAGMEFLGCGAVDNSTGPPEYTGAGRLTHYVGYQLDVTDRVERQHQLDRLAS